jgi:hypothetical protein
MRRTGLSLFLLAIFLAAPALARAGAGGGWSRVDAP